ncbi:MAG: redoxin domain-containing protein, partial [Planctomycetota bacterium]
QGRVTGPDGQSVAFATIQIREYNPGARSIKAPNRGTNEQGYYKCDGINWPYTVGVLRYKLMPSVLGRCHQYLFYNRVFEERETVGFQFKKYPTGNATVEGRVLDQNKNPLEEFFVDVSTKMDWDVRKNPDGKFYSTTGYRVPYISKDGSFKLDNLPEGDFDVRVIPFKIQMYEMHRGESIRLEAGKVATVNLEVVLNNVLYGRILFRDGSPAVVKPIPWPGAKTSILFTLGMGMARGIAKVDDEGYFAVNLSGRELEMLKSGASRLIINVPTSEERRNKSMGDFPFEKLSEDKSKAGILKIEHPDRKPLSLIDKSLPEFEGIDIDFDTGQTKNILVCFFDIEQRPSRNCLAQLANRAEQLKEKGIIVVAIHAAKVEQAKLNEWIDENKITFPVGIIAGQEKQVHFDWGVKSLPWLILTDRQHNVIAEGFGLNNLDTIIEEINNVAL